MPSLNKLIKGVASRVAEPVRSLATAFAPATSSHIRSGGFGGTHIHSRQSPCGSVYIDRTWGQDPIAPTGQPGHLFGIHPWLDDKLSEFGTFGALNQSFHAGTQGDLSLLPPRQISDILVERFAETASDYFPFERFHEIVGLRRDGGEGYCGEGVVDRRLSNVALELAGRVLIVTATDSSIPAIKDDMEAGVGGRGVTALQISPSGDALRLVYGLSQYGTLPSSETLVHVASAAMMAQEGRESGATVHCHSYPIVRLALHSRLLDGGFCNPKRLNASLLRLQSWLFQGKEHTVTVVPIPYQHPGSAALVRATMDVLPTSSFILWENHGTVVRASSIKVAYGMTASVSRAAEAGWDSLEHGHGGLPMSEDLYYLLQRKGLLREFADLFGDINHARFSNS